MNQSHIRNFAIIAHIDHGKSTLADRLLELTGTVQKRDMQEQILDSNPIERERGITIKLAPVRMTYRRKQVLSSNSKFLNKSQNPNKLEIRNSDLEIANSAYTLNLIDTPGHVDFGYEVSRSLAACEGAILVVDATQGVQAQTLANLHQARQHGLTIIPVINKIDMPSARIRETSIELRELGFEEEEILQISAKTGENVENVLEAVVRRIPAPDGEPAEPLRALVFSSQYDPHKGVVVFVRVVDGNIHHRIANKDIEYTNKNVLKDSSIRTNSSFVDKSLRFMASGVEFLPIEIGYFTPKMTPSDILRTGEVGYIATGLKDAKLAKVGDTILDARNSTLVPLPGYKEPKPVVFLSLFPISADEYTDARDAVEKLRLSDSAFTFRPISSHALGNGFHCGFLGLLHAEIVQERLSREFNLYMIATSPSVEYLIGPSRIQSAVEFPDNAGEVSEPLMKVDIYSPKAYVGAIMQLAQEKRGEYSDLSYEADQAHIVYLMPLSEMIVDFFDRLKSVTEGYASLDYEFFDYQVVDVVKVDILLNHEKVDALAFLATKQSAQLRGRELVERLAEVIPRQQFSIPVQAAVGSPRSSSGGAGGQIIARSDVKPFRKDVTKKLYGGDRTRKDKLLDAQKKGKAKMKMVGKVEIPQTAFFEVLKRT